MSTIALYGSGGKIGSILHGHWAAKGYRIYPVERGDNTRPLSETVVWCATVNHDHTNFGQFSFDLEEYNKLARQCYSPTVKRLIFTSSFGLENEFGAVRAFNGYAACKIAGEALTEGVHRCDPEIAAIIIRMGGFGPSIPAGAWYEMTPKQIIDVYDHALQLTGFHILSPTRAKRPKEAA